MIRILQFVNTLGCNNGMMSVIMNYYRHIDRSKVQFDFLYYSERENNYISEIEELGGKIYKLNYSSNLLKVKKGFERFFKQEKGKYKVMQIHSLMFARLIRSAAEKNGIEHMILHIHATKYSAKPINNFLDEILCFNIDKVSNELFACSLLAAEYAYSKKSIRTGKVRILNNAIECDDFKFVKDKRRRIREELGIPEEDVIVGAIGRLTKAKNHTFLIGVFSEYIKRYPNSHLVIAGEGPLYDELMEKIEGYSLQDNVHLLGLRKDVPDILASFDVFILPSTSAEGFPVSVVEAEVSGLPCIIADSVTKEVDIICCEFVSLKGGIDKWCDTICSMVDKAKSIDRKMAYKTIEDAGYDIREEAKKLCDYYLNLSIEA